MGSTRVVEGSTRVVRCPKCGSTTFLVSRTPPKIYACNECSWEGYSYQLIRVEEAEV